MGIIDETRETISHFDSEYMMALSTARDRVIDDVMADVAELMAQPVYEGDLDHALVHHFGRAAFEGEDTKPFTEFAKAIQEAESDVVPFLLSVNPNEHPEDARYASYTVFAVVDPSNLMFRSETSRRKEVKMHAFTDETAGVTDKKLSLVVPNVSISGDLDVPRSFKTNASTDDTLLLSESHIADDGQGLGLGTYQFGDSERVYIQLNSWEEPYVQVGWKAIEEATLDYVGSDVNSLFALEDLLSKAEGAKGWRKQMPQLAAKLRAAKMLQKTHQ